VHFRDGEHMTVNLQTTLESSAVVSCKPPIPVKGIVHSKLKLSLFEGLLTAEPMGGALAMLKTHPQTVAIWINLFGLISTS